MGHVTFEKYEEMVHCTMDPLWLRVDVPEGRSGPWQVRCSVITQEAEQMMKLRGLINNNTRDYLLKAGTYTQLVHDNLGIMMSDTVTEVWEHRWPIEEAKGKVLINGLGIGMVANACLMKKEVRNVTVVEIDEDVIKLVAPHYQEKYGDRFRLVQADAFEYQPVVNERFDVVWHDIWLNICDTNLPEMHRLHRKYGRRCNWQGSWMREACENMREAMAIVDRGDKHPKAVARVQKLASMLGIA